ncbi:hypothetical protein [Sphingomonas sp. 22R3R2A-7]|uniref:hypothetical protein n=1 Tax=Sphingomonas sp. 22R3R2A-7 TaxID=3050230 RepID=UPI002FDF0EC0
MNDDLLASLRTALAIADAEADHIVGDHIVGAHIMTAIMILEERVKDVDDR